MNKSKVTKALNSTIPNYLETPASSVVNPPTTTRKQTLPVKELLWEDFEKLCLRLVRLDKNVEYCQTYGEKGDEQKGIDLYARNSTTDKYSVHQCKNVKDFSANKIKEAVTIFLDGKEWVGKSDTFFLWTRESLKSKKRADAVLAQAEILKTNGITFIPRDEEQLSLLLKDKPEIVDDFFGRSWVKAFCGDDAAEKLGKRLDVEAVVKLRSKYLTLYRTVFNRQDPGLPLYLSLDQTNIPFEQRYIVPDVYLDKKQFIQKNTQNKSEGNSGDNVEGSPSGTNEQTTVAEYRQRKNVGNWLVEQEQNVVLGDPGGGKSSLLRLIAIDLLNESPRISAIASKWGRYLPVWIPFGLWTQRIKNGDDGFKDVLKAWLKHWGEEELFTLVDQAIEEKKILLLVDGLDEWVDESAAKLALNQLQVFIDLHKVPVILTSRPQGFENLQLRENEWSIATLSDLTVEQQEEICRIWFTNKLVSINKENNHTNESIQKNAYKEASHFVRDLNNNIDLLSLTKNPLLLCLLLAIKFQDGHLPEDRFKAYEHIVNHFTANHPEKRKEAALVTAEQRKLSSEDLRKTYAYLAYKMQEDYPQGAIDETNTKSILQKYLTSQEVGLGIETSVANDYVNNILEFGEKNLGLLVKKSPNTFGFFHRTFLEFLAAQHLSSLPLKEQIKIVKKRCTNPQWKEVLLCLFFLTKKPDEIGFFIAGIKSKKLNLLERCHTNLLIYEVTFGNFNCSTALARNLTIEAFSEIQTMPWMPERDSLMNLILNGLNSTKVQQLVREKLSTWFPNKETWRTFLYQAMWNWPFEEETISTLKLALYDESMQNQKSAAIALAKVARGDKQVGDFLASVVQNDLDLNTRAAAFEGLIEGWIDHPKINNLIRRSEQSIYPIFKLLAIRAKILKKIHGDSDLDILLILGAWQTGVGYEWREMVESALLEGWPKSQKVKEACLDSLHIIRKDAQIEREVALKVLLKGFAGDQSVIEYCVNQIKHETHPFLSLHGVGEAWDMLTSNFKDNPEIVSAIDEWLGKTEHDVVDISRATLVGRTKVAKKKLFELLSDHLSFWVAGALLEGWGIKDQEVFQALISIAEGNAEQASRLGYLIPKIIDNKEKARNILLELLKNPKTERPDFVMRGLIELGNTDADEKVVEIAINRFKKYPNAHYDDMFKFHLLKHYSFSKKVLTLAKSELKTRRDGNYAAIAAGFANNPVMRKEILKLLAPLDSPLRQIIAKRLGDNKQDDFSITLLKDYDLEKNDAVKTTAAIAFYKSLAESKRDVSKEIKQLSKDIVCYGSDYEERRQAAFCGLVILKRLDIMVKAKERIGNDRLSAVSIKRGTDVNLPFVNCILENWDYVKTVFGEGFVSRFTKFSGVDDFWDSVAIYADSYSEVSKDLLNLLEEDKLPPKSNILQFLARVKPKSQLLLDYCLKFLSYLENPRNFPSTPDIFAVIGVIGEHFAKNEDALGKLLNGKKLSQLDDTLIALVYEIWPGNSKARKLNDLLYKEKRKLTKSTYYELSTRYYPPEAVFKDIIKLLKENEKHLLNQYEAREIFRLLSRRMKFDPTLQKLSVQHLKTKATASEKISLGKLISKSGHSNKDFSKWRNQELKNQADRDYLEVGFDLSVGNFDVITKTLISV